MDWTVETREGLEIALNEAEVLGVRSEDGGRTTTFLLKVDALPEEGTMDPDGRRRLVLHHVHELRFLLRPVVPQGLGPALPLEDLDAVEDFLASLDISGTMYGWRFLDVSGLTDGWPSAPSLVVPICGDPAAHTFYWFNECARVEDGQVRHYRLEGTAAFEDLSVRRADGSVLPLEEFIDDGVRWWRGLHDFDPRAEVVTGTGRDRTPRSG